MSKITPNTTQVPNLHLDKAMYLLDESELKTLLYAVRRTMGFHKDSDRISLSQFMSGNGRIDDSGDPVEHGTGLTKTTQIKALSNLVSFGFMFQVAENVNNLGAEWALQLDDTKIDWSTLQARLEDRKQRGEKQTKKARTAAAAKQKQGGLFNRPPESENERSIQQTAGGLFNRPQVVYSTDTQKKEEKKKRKPVLQSEQSSPDDGLEIAWGMLLTLCAEDQTKAAKVWQLQKEFSAVSHIAVPDIDTEDGRSRLKRIWWPYLLTILDDAENNLDIAIVGMKTAVAEMDEWKSTAVQSPKSIIGKTQAAIAGLKRGAPANGNGRKNGHANGASDLSQLYANIPVGKYGI